MTKATLRRQDLAEMADLMDEAAENLYLIPKDIASRHEVRPDLSDELEGSAITIRESIAGTLGISVEQARKILAQGSKGTLTRTSADCRAWLDGEWRLDELEALCVILRHEAGDQARGAPELVV
ncbi:hypothetical protein, partial [Microbacterium sp. P5_E9]